MKVTEMKSSPEKPNPHNVSVRMLYNTEHAQAVHIELNPGEALKKHMGKEVIKDITKSTETLNTKSYWKV